MAARPDNFGLWWNDVPQERAGRGTIVRPTPPIPQTGWRPPSHFPDLRDANIIAIDTETCDPALREKGPGFRRGAYVCGVSVGTDDGFRGYYPVRHKMGGNIDPDTVFRWLSDQLEGNNTPVVGANLLYDLDALSNEGVDIGPGPKYDVQNAEAILDEYKFSYALEVLGQEYLGEGKTSEALYRWSAAAFGGNPTARDQAQHIWQCPVELVGPYAEGDVDLPIRIFKMQREKLNAERLWPIFDLETRLIPLLLAMRQRGIRVDMEQAMRVKEELSAMLREMDRTPGGIKIADVNSGEAIARFCDKNGITYPRTAASKNHPKGQPSFVKDWLKNNPHPSMQQLSRARTYLKYRDTFITSYLEGNQINGRVHCQFNQLRSDEAGTVTGRFSSSNPNLQNIPKRGDDKESKRLAKLMRSPFSPDFDEDFVRFDWSQIEFRLIVHKAVGRGAEHAREMYNADPNTDFHNFVIALTQLQREYAKNINFGIAFGMGIDLLCSTMGVSRDKGVEILDKYHAGVPFVESTAAAASRSAKMNEVIRTILGRCCRFPDGDFAHKALNRFTQGSSADIMKASMATAWESGICDVLGAPLLTVHDELVWSAPKTRAAKEALAECKHIMENTVKLKVPTPVAMEVGTNWGNVEEAPDYLKELENDEYELA